MFDVCAAHGERAAVGVDELDVNTHGSSLREDEYFPVLGPGVTSRRNVRAVTVHPD